MQLSWNTLLSFLLNLHQVFFTLLRFWMAESSILLLRAVWSEHCWLSIWIQEKFVEQCIQVCWFLHHERKREIIPWDRNNWIYSCCCLVGFIVTQSIFCHRAYFLLYFIVFQQSLNVALWLEGYFKRQGGGGRKRIISVISPVLTSNMSFVLCSCWCFFAVSDLSAFHRKTFAQHNIFCIVLQSTEGSALCSTLFWPISARLQREVVRSKWSDISTSSPSCFTFTRCVSVWVSETLAL